MKILLELTPFFPGSEESDNWYHDLAQAAVYSGVGIEIFTTGGNYLDLATLSQLASLTVSTARPYAYFVPSMMIVTQGGNIHSFSWTSELHPTPSQAHRPWLANLTESFHENVRCWILRGFDAFRYFIPLLLE
jgi:hypothetical protein